MSKVALLLSAALLLTACASKDAKKTEAQNTNPEKVDWLEAPSLKDAYAGIFEHIGVAINEKEFKDPESMDGVIRHFNSITMENEFKPQFMFNWQQPNTNGTFTSSKGVTIKVPTNVPDFSRMDSLLKFAQLYDIQLRGHVLVWHSQTEKSFFRENFKANGALVDAETMDAREEWYIKTVLEHVANWEAKFNKNKRIIYAWDVVNEAVSDSANASAWLRTDSDWYAIFKNSDFIINAFRYANKYAPADVQLAYNDYNCTMSGKTAGILKIIDGVKATASDDFLPGRINIIGMQSHVQSATPAATSFDVAIRQFLAKEVDVQITELDVAGLTAATDKVGKYRYNELFKTFKKYEKIDGAYGISGVTIWGLNDERSWISKGGTQTPLLFTKDNEGYKTKAAFFGALEAASAE